MFEIVSIMVLVNFSENVFVPLIVKPRASSCKFDRQMSMQPVLETVMREFNDRIIGVVHSTENTACLELVYLLLPPLTAIQWLELDYEMASARCPHLDFVEAVSVTVLCKHNWHLPELHLLG